MRPFLLFDTATDHLAVAVGDLEDRSAVLAADDFPAPRAANTVLLSSAERVLASAGLRFEHLCAIGCGRGPGSFTGVRIGVATAKGLAHGRGVPLVGFGTLDAVAAKIVAGLAPDEGQLLGVVGDAMRGEVYPALFRVRSGGVERMTADRVTLPEVAATEWAQLGRRVVLGGQGLVKHRAVFEGILGDDGIIADGALWTPDGPALVRAAWTAAGDSTVASIRHLPLAEAYRIAHPAALLPVYTRLSDAEEAERSAGRSVPHNGVAGPRGGETG